MENRANYVAVGAFVMLCVIGTVVTLLWLAGAQYNQEYAYFQTVFKGPVTGLGNGTVTRYNGIDVGRVTDMQFSASDPRNIIVTLEVRPNLNIREDSVASIASQGLTGGSYVEIDGGSVNSPLLVAKPGQKYPVIRSKVSSIEQLEESAPELVAKLNTAASQLNDLLNDKNRAAISDILSNLDQTTTVLARRGDDIDMTLHNVGQLTQTLKEASLSLKPTLNDADTTVTKMGKLADDADAFVNGEGLAQLPDLVVEMRRLVSSVNRFSDQLNREPTKLLFGDRRKGYEPK